MKQHRKMRRSVLFFELFAMCSIKHIFILFFSILVRCYQLNTLEPFPPNEYQNIFLTTYSMRQYNDDICSSYYAHISTQSVKLHIAFGNRSNGVFRNCISSNIFGASPKTECLTACSLHSRKHSSSHKLVHIFPCCTVFSL